MVCALVVLSTACTPGPSNNQHTRNTPLDVGTAAVRDSVKPPVNTEEPPAGDCVSFDGGLRVYPKLKRVELKANLIGGQSRPLEFFLVGAGGGTHESLFVTAASAEHLKRGLEVIGIKEGKAQRNGRGFLDDPVGDAVLISVRFRHAKTGELMKVRAEQWLWDTIAGAMPEPVGFVFSGGQEEYASDQNRSVVSADQLGNYIAMWHDASCVLDNARKHGVISDCYTPNPDAPGMPAAGAEVTLIFEAHP